MTSCYYYRDPPKDWEIDEEIPMPKNYLTILSDALCLPTSDRVDLLIHLLKDFKTEHQALLISSILGQCDKQALSLGKSLHRMKQAVSDVEKLGEHPLLDVESLKRISQNLIRNIEEN